MEGVCPSQQKEKLHLGKDKETEGEREGGYGERGGKKIRRKKRKGGRKGRGERGKACSDAAGVGSQRGGGNREKTPGGQTQGTCRSVLQHPLGTQHSG